MTDLFFFFHYLNKLWRNFLWIRLLYCYPEEITPELVQVMKEEKKICHYLDMPIQHSSDRILKKMGRRTNRKELLDKIEMLRTEIPDIVLRTTLITGFPGETQEDFEEMLSFVDMVGFERLGVFPYSPEEGKPAAEMEDQIDEEVKKQRRDAIMELQQEISFDFEADCVGEKLLVMIKDIFQMSMPMSDEPTWMRQALMVTFL